MLLPSDRAWNAARQQPSMLALADCLDRLDYLDEHGRMAICAAWSHVSHIDRLRAEPGGAIRFGPDEHADITFSAVTVRDVPTIRAACVCGWRQE